MLFKFVVIKQELQKEFEFDSVYNVLVVTCTFNISETLHFSVVDGKQRTPLPPHPCPPPHEKAGGGCLRNYKEKNEFI